MGKDNSILNIAIIDDYDIFREQFKKQFAACDGLNINIAFEADNGADALRLLECRPIDILFTDIRMPKIDGLKLLELVKNNNLCKCVVLLSEYTDFEYAKKGLVCGAFDYMVKPVSTEDIEAVFKRAAVFLSESSSSPAVDTYDETSITECIKNHGTQIRDLARDFIKHYQSEKNEDLFHFAADIINPLQRITKSLFDSFEWLKNVSSPFGQTKKQLFAIESIDAVSIFTQEYLLSLHRIVNEYYPENISAMSKKIIDYVLSNPYEKITLSDISKLMYANNTYISHAFKKDMGISLTDYCNRYKMDIAKIMLKYTELSITEIADKLCYDDYKYMGRLFKNTYGLTPSKYRRIYAC